MKKGWLFAAALGLACPALAQREFCIKGAAVLNSSAAPSFTWLVIQESSYYIKNIISFGYETQFSYYAAGPDELSAGAGGNAYPINVFITSKVKIVRRGFLRPFLGAGVGVLAEVVNYPDHYAWNKSLATQVSAGISIGGGPGAAIQIEFRMMNADGPGFKTKYLIVGGLAY
jgi:hypothetical protein